MSSAGARIGLAFGVTALAVVAFEVALRAGVFPSDPATIPVGLRVAGDRITAVVPACPGRGVREVDASLYAADVEGPKTPMWSQDLVPGSPGPVTVVLGAPGNGMPGTRARGTLPPVSAHRPGLTFGFSTGSGGGSWAFDLDEVTSTRLSPRQFWTVDGPQTAAQIAHRYC